MPTIDWDAAEDDGLVSYVYIDDLDDIRDALDVHWDDVAAAAAALAWRDVTCRGFDARAFVARHGADAETMRLAYATLRAHGGTLDACADWSAVEACLAYWISFDHYRYDLAETRARLARAGIAA